MDTIMSPGTRFTSTATQHRGLGINIRQRVNSTREQDYLFFWLYVVKLTYPGADDHPSILCT